MSKDTGGPAFPSNRDMRHNPDWDWEGGMTLRDYFAAKAMQAAHTHFDGSHVNGFDGLARFCYSYADAMLKAREA